MEELKANWKAFKYRGPSSSKDFNEFIDNSFIDLSNLKRETTLLYEEAANSIGKTARAHAALTNRLRTLSNTDRDTGSICYADLSIADNITYLDRYDDSIPANSRLSHNPYYGFISLPGQVMENLAVKTTQGYLVPDYIQTAWEGTYEAADVSSDDERRALNGWDESVYERVSILASSATPTEGNYYVNVPSQLMRRPDSNFIQIHPFPPSMVSYRLAYTTTYNPSLSSGETWNYFPEYISASGPTGYVTNAIPSRIYFPSYNITGLKVSLKQDTPFTIGNDYVFSMGLANLSLGYIRYSTTTGMCRVIIDKPTGSFSELGNVIIGYSNMAEADKANNYSVYAEISPDNTQVYVELSLANDGSLDGGGGNVLTHAPQITSIGIEYT